MNRMNAKRIGVLAASLLFGLAVAGPVSYQGIQIIGNSGTPLVQIVIGSQAKPSDGVVAGNIAATIGSLSYTSQAVTATPTGTSGVKCVVTTPSCSITNQQVWLGETGTVSAPSGSFSFTALIGSVLNQAAITGSPQSTKFIQTGTTYTFQEGSGGTYTITASPLNSPYTAATNVPTGSSTPSGTTNGGGLTFQSFQGSSGGNVYDNIMQISNSQLPALLSNSGAYGESEYLWLTGFPVYDQQTTPSVQSYALLSAGGAYEAVFNKPIHQPYYSTAVGNGAGVGTNTINNAAITLLGQSWTIVSVTLPTGGVTTSTAIAGGKLGLAKSLVPLTTVYVGKNVTSGPFTVQLADLGTAASNGVSPAAINIYYQGVLTNNTSIWPGPSNTLKFNVSGNQVYVHVNNTFAGLYAYQKYAKIQIYSNVYNVTSGQTFNQTNDPGWDTELLWTNTTGSTHGTDLYGIILYNVTPGVLTPGQSFAFIQNPQRYKVTFVGDTLGTNLDAMTFSSQFAGSVQYSNAGANPGAGNANLELGNINNVTEPAQELVVTSQIPNAFTFAGQSTSTLTYVLTPYILNLVQNSVQIGGTDATIGTSGIGTPVNVALAVSSPYIANFITSGHQLAVTLTGYTKAGGSSITQTVYFSANSVGGQAGIANTMNGISTTGNFFNITSVTFSRALPGLTVAIAPNSITTAGSTTTPTYLMANVFTNSTPSLIYTKQNQAYYSLQPGTSVIYNQQNGQPTTTFSMSTAAVTSLTGTNFFSDFTYNAVEIDAPSNTASTDAFGFELVNSTAGPGASPLFYLNYSRSGQWNNVTYFSSTSGVINARVGFRSERGSEVSAISPTQITLDMAKSIDTLQFIVGPVNSTVAPTSTSQVGPYKVGQTTNLPNVTIAAVNATCSFTSTSCTVTGLNNVSAVVSGGITNVTTPNPLNTVTTPLVVLDSNATAGTQIVIGSKYVNSVAQQIAAQNPTFDSNFGPSSVVVQAFGSNRILVAGYYANQTVQAGNQFIQALLAQAQ